MLSREQIIKQMVDKFLVWSLPDSVRADDCATVQGYKHRSGTNLLTADEARQMFEHVLPELAHLDAQTPEGAQPVAASPNEPISDDDAAKARRCMYVEHGWLCLRDGTGWLLESVELKSAGIADLMPRFEPYLPKAPK